MMRYFLCLGILAAAVLVDGQPGFVSIDCGFSGDYVNSDLDTNITYEPDAQFIDTGSNHELDEFYLTYMPAQARNLRSFPDGTRNCYNIKNVIRGYKYLIRASFLYGNYDNKITQTDNGDLTFDLYLGVSLWKTMKIINVGQLYIAEIITLASSDSFLICLLRTGHGTPFISALELRPISNGIYHDVNSTVSLLLWERLDIGSDQTVRYPDDLYDRKWMSDRITCLMHLYRCDRDFMPKPYVEETNELVLADPDDPYAVPSKVMQTAKMPPDNITLRLDFDNGSTGSTPPFFYIYLHFSELSMPKANASRVFQVEIPGAQPTIHNMTSEYLVEKHVRVVYQAGTDSSTYYLNLTRMPGSTRPPLINAMEVYSKINLSSIATEGGDVDAMMAIKRQYEYGMHKYNWQGDPCVPANLTWSKVNCTSSSSTSLRVISLNLSFEGLEGPILTAIANLTALKFLDLSNNYLTGTIPDFLAKLSSLQSLDLSYNKLDGPVPADLCHKQAKDLLWLRYHNTFRFNEKSDVYGFGIVLLELVTGLPAVLKFRETGHILQWVKEGLARGNVADIVDLRLRHRYDVYSVKKIIDLALHCTSMDTNERPTMTVVLMLLKEILQLELAREEPELSMSSSTEITDVSRTRTSEITISATELSDPSAR